MRQHKIFCLSRATSVRSLFTKCSLILFIYSAFLSNLNAKPSPINIHQHQNGRGDIRQMWPHENIMGIMRNALRPDAQNRWIHYKDKDGNYVIPYVIAGKFTQSEYKIIHGAFDVIAKNSCIQFKKKTSSHFDYVEIQNQRGQGCYTMVGRMPGKNVVMLESNEEATCVLHQTVVHELFHTIGLWHEQMRHDRDDYIKVHYENIPDSFYPQFKKVPLVQSITYGVQYDYSSVMHYAMVPGAITMQTKKKDAQNIIGKVKKASVGDWRKVCSIYNCPKCMGKSFKRGQQSTSNKKDKEKDTKKGKEDKKDDGCIRCKDSNDDDYRITSIWSIFSLNSQPNDLGSIFENSRENTSPVLSQQFFSSADDDSTFFDKASFEDDLNVSSDTWKIDGDGNDAKVVVINTSATDWTSQWADTSYGGDI